MLLPTMTQEQIKKLQEELWDAANQLRANSKLTAAEYKDPVLGLVLLRFAQNRYEEVKTVLSSQVSDGPRPTKQITKDKYLAAGAIMLPEEAQYDYLAHLPEDVDIAEKINDAMKMIEAEYPDLSGILPKNYQEFESSLLRELIRLFNKDSVKKATGDVFGRIYEYFLMKFSMQGAGAQEGGEFFTPPSLVQLIVNFIEPENGIIHDPACGSGGMFVQTGYFVRSHTNKVVNEAIKCYGTELKTNNYKLAKMNLAIHGIEGHIIERNSFYSDPHSLVEKCDFVMANPPFNVKKIDKNKQYVKDDPRLPFGLPKSDNGNYMWIQYFYSYLNEKGRAGFVMPSSATDAGHSEEIIRIKLIETGHVDCIVSVGNNFFYTRALPCHLWFLDKGKSKENLNNILMIDARNVFRKVTTTINDFSPGQLLNLTAIMKMYRGINNAFKDTIAEHQKLAFDLLEKINEYYISLADGLIQSAKELKIDLPINSDIIITLPKEYAEAENILKQFSAPIEKANEIINKWQSEISKLEQEIKEEKTDEKIIKKQLQAIRSKISLLNRPINVFTDESKEYISNSKQQIKDWKHFVEWFSNGKYNDVEGLCKIVSLEDIIENEYSLTPGRYVGYAFQSIGDFNYNDSMNKINNELKELKVVSEYLTNKIMDNSSQWILNNLKSPPQLTETNIGSLIEYEIGGGWGDDVIGKTYSEPAYVIRGTDIDEILKGNFQTVPFRFHKKSNLESRKLEEGDIVFEVSGGSQNEGVAKTLLITKEILNQFDNDVMCASFCKLVRPINKNLSNYLFLFLRFLREIKGTEVFEIRSASNIVNYNWSAFLKFQKLKIPDDNKLKIFNELVTSLYKQIFILGNKNQLLKNSMDMILPEIYSK